MLARSYIRLADPADLPAVMDLLTAFHAENGIAPLNRDKVEAEVLSLAEQADLFLVECNGEPIGTLGLVESVLWYSDASTLGAHFFYVVPEHRGGPVGPMLLEAATLEADRRQLPFFVSIQNPKRAARRGRIAEIEGYSPFGWSLRLR